MQYRFLVAGALALMPLTAFSQQVTNPRSGVDYDSLDSAIAESEPGDTLELGPGSHVVSTGFITHGLALQGTGPDEVTIVNNTAGPTVLHLVGAINVELSDLTIASETRAGISAQSVSSLTVHNVHFETAGLGTGGGIAFSEGTLTITNSSFSTSSGGHGGALSASLGATVLIEDTVFSGTSSGGQGGAIFATDNSSVTCTECEVFDAQAADLGGAFRLNGGSLTLNGGTFQGNSGSAGGAIHISNGSLDVDGTRFFGNASAAAGGAIRAENPTSFQVLRSHFCSNSAASGSNGGAIHVSNPATSGLIAATAFTGNSADAGGAMHLGGDWSLDNLTVLHTSGSAIYVASGSTAIHNGYFAYNQDFVVETAVAGTAIVDWTAFYENQDPPTGGNVTLTNPVEGLGDPLFGSYAAGMSCGDQELWPSFASPLLDAGDPAVFDPDGSVSDLGAYGGPEADPYRHLTNEDGDGFVLMKDCDDTRDDVYPGAPEVCDGVDNNCDGTIDVDAIDAPDWWPDFDGDTYGDKFAAPVAECEAPPQHVDNNLDCDDTRADVNPAAAEYCDSVDRDCDGDLHRGAVDAFAWYPDHDEDGFGDSAAAPTMACVAPVGYVINNDDCDDTNDEVFPGAEETCDGVDNNCSGDESDAEDAVPLYPDADGDGFGDEDAAFIIGCELYGPPGYVANADDCDDSDNAVNPDAVEVCDGIDNDCDGVIDNVEETSLWWPDADGDGFGADGQEQEFHCPPDASEWAQQGGDCDDTDPTVHPEADEVCDGKDNTCNGLVDDDDPALVNDEDLEGGVQGGIEVWNDEDGDGYGAGESLRVCDTSGYALNGDDCDDTDPAIHPGATEIPGNHVDEDCDGRVSDPPTNKTKSPDDGKSCGCAHGGPNPGWILPFLAVMMIRRRRS